MRPLQSVPDACSAISLYAYALKPTAPAMCQGAREINSDYLWPR